ncbi:MAG: DUF4249 family protein [Saprospiraceae bacterium]|nr:DUF4249 family protein [Saprospiraceae bacterium]
MWRVGLDLDIGANPFTIKDSIILDVFLTSSSKEYEQYIRNQEAKSASQNNPFAEPAAPYTNMKGGYGFFIFSGRANATIDVGD